MSETAIREINNALDEAVPRQAIADGAKRKRIKPTKKEVELLTVMRNSLLSTLWPAPFQERDPILDTGNQTLILLRKQAYSALINAEEQIIRHGGKEVSAIIAKTDADGNTISHLGDWKARAEYNGMPEELASQPQAFARSMYQIAFLVQQDLLHGLHTERPIEMAEKLREVGESLERRLNNNFGIGMLTGVDANAILPPERYEDALKVILKAAAAHNEECDPDQIKGLISDLEAKDGEFKRPPEVLRTSRDAVLTGQNNRVPSRVPDVLERMVEPIMKQIGIDLATETIDLQVRLTEALKVAQEFFELHKPEAEALFQAIVPQNVQNLGL